MDRVEEWFLSEFGPLGFSLGPLTREPTTFEPKKCIFFRDTRRTLGSMVPPLMKTKMAITPMFVGIHIEGLDMFGETKCIIGQTLRDFLDNKGIRYDVPSLVIKYWLPKFNFV